MGLARRRSDAYARLLMRLGVALIVQIDRLTPTERWSRKA
jgi:hypothetical protein